MSHMVNLNKQLTESIETVQKRALKCIYPGNEYADMLCLTNLPCLKERRDSLCQIVLPCILYACMYCIWPYVNPTRWSCK